MNTNICDIYLQKMYSSLQQMLRRLEEDNGRTKEEQIIKELRHIRGVINSAKELTEDQKKSLFAQENRVKTLLQKPKTVLKAQEKLVYRQALSQVVKSVQKKIAQLGEKKGKDARKRQTTIDIYRLHQQKLSIFCEWLLSPSRQFALEQMRKLIKYLNDLHMSQDDSVFQEQVKALYEKIVSFAEEPVQLSHEQFVASHNSRPRLNDYLPSKQTKENSYRNSLCPNYRMIQLETLPSVSSDVLFFMFFYHKGEVEQYMAAKQLMRRHWRYTFITYRYYTKFNLWISRTQLPNFDSAQEVEVGCYFSIGIDLVMRQRKNIKIIHKYLISKLA